MTHNHITVFGGLVFDYIMVTDRQSNSREIGSAREFKKAPGGKGAYAAVAAHRTSHNEPTMHTDKTLDTGEREIKVRMVGAIGNDEHKIPIKRELHENDIDTTGVRVVSDMPTSQSFVVFEEDEKHTYVLCHAGATNIWKPEDFLKLENLVGDTHPDLVIYTMEVNIPTVEQVIHTAGQAGLDVLLYACPASTIRADCYLYITHLIANEEEIGSLTRLSRKEVNEDTWRSIAERFVKQGIDNVVITLEDGVCYATTEGSGLFQSKLTLIDPKGAGETFVGTYAAEYVRQKSAGEGWDIVKAIERACLATGATDGHFGMSDRTCWANWLDGVVWRYDQDGYAQGVRLDEENDKDEE